MRTHKIGNIQILFFLGGLLLLTTVSNAQAMRVVIKKDNTIEKLFGISELNIRYQAIESFIEKHKNIYSKSLKPSHAGFAKNLIRHQKGPSFVRNNLKQAFRSSFNHRHANASIKWFKSQTGQKILNAKIIGDFFDNKKEREIFKKRILDSPLKQSRLLIIKRIVAEESMTEQIQSLFFAYVKSMAPFNETLKGKRLFKVMKMLQKKTGESVVEKVRLQRLFDFRDLEQKDLKAYARFLESPAGKWFTFSELNGFKKGIKQTLDHVQKIQRKLLIEIERGGPEFPLIKAIAPAGQRYLLVRLRDSFKPLFTEKELVIIKEKPEAFVKVRKLGDDLGNTALIPLYIMNKIKNNRPKLFKKLKYYERLFNSREDIKTMSGDEYAETLVAYRKVLNQASKIKVSKTPLQTDYTKLRFTGTISKNNKILALVETSDQKGYVVNEGNLIGPMFGFVDEVHPEKIIVIEKFRNYLGNILTIEKILEFAKNI